MIAKKNVDKVKWWLWILKKKEWLQRLLWK